jgi:methylenetetrahydrofolate dehydrogenase (NADP+)/methenyltetrahydrofolate cyclohydrolase
MVKLFDGRTIAHTREQALAVRIATADVVPTLGIIRVGENPASALYTARKTAAAERIGMRVQQTTLANTATVADVEQAIDTYNADPSVHGILLQLPLPSALAPHTDTLIKRIVPVKDADGFHPTNRTSIQARAKEQTPPAPVLPQAVRLLLEHTQESLAGRTLALLVKSEDILGKGMSEWLMPLGIHTIYTGIDRAHPLVAQADIIVCALGQTHTLRPEHIHPGAILIDIGTNPQPDGRVMGDIHPACDTVAAWRSPVPGGVGPLTVQVLLENVCYLSLSRMRQLV